VTIRFNVGVSGSEPTPSANASPSPLVAGSLGTWAEIDRAVSSTSSSNSIGAPIDRAPDLHFLVAGAGHEPATCGL
jgi:hypothetical protein